MKSVDRFHAGLDVFLRWFCVILFVVMVGLVLCQVTVRFLDISAPWTEVGARLAFIWQGIIGAAYVIGEKDDVAIDWLVRKLPLKGVKVVSMLAHAIVAGFALWIMVWGGYRNVEAGWDNTVQLLPISQGQTFLVIPIAGSLIVVYSILHIIDIARAPAESLAPVEPEGRGVARLTDEGI